MTQFLASLDVMRRFQVIKIYVDKSAVLFSKNTPLVVGEVKMNHQGISKILFKDKYLGLPIMVGRAKKKEFQALKERLWHRMQGWQSKLLSLASKAVLIQAVAQAIPLYSISCFKFPKYFVHDLNIILAKFWWGSKGEKRGIHWTAWDNLCVSKMDGGIGFKDFESFNLAF